MIMSLNNDLEILKKELPDVFEGSKVPESWAEDWIFLPGESEDDIHPIYQTPEATDAPLKDCRNPISLETWHSYYGRRIVFSDVDGGKDGPVLDWDRKFLPPVDALGFYIPYHYGYRKNKMVSYSTWNSCTQNKLTRDLNLLKS
jgi:hypothetical protein